MRFAASLFVAMQIFVLTGCVSSRSLVGAERLPAVERVTLIPKHKQVALYKVDNDHRGYGFVGSFQITPGIHTLHLNGVVGAGLNSINVAEVKYTYDFKPGRTYTIEGTRSVGVLVAVIDQATGQELERLPSRR